ncbi:unnamed protein product [Mytilus edulis]|uniref:Tyr recombinase domain-containing protein n=1 Tax=Mytilus edulis TaxID=6550 RepID=A0A8S3UM68_MYTED|nr:unnamed protein product [Mytilus edulis]
MDDIDLLEWDPIFLTQSSYSQVSEEKESDILSYFDLKPSDNDLEITRHQFRHGQPETVKSLQNKIEESVPKNSVKKYKWGYNAFNSWQAERRLRPISDNLGIPPNCLQKDLVHMDKTELSTSLQYFIAEAKKKDGGTYPSNSIYDLFSSIQGYIRHQKSSSINFFTDPEFLRARQVLDAIMKERATEGLGANARKQADVISVDEETSLYDKGILGVDNPQQLLDTLLYLCGLHFALRGGTEHRRLRLNSNPQITGPFQDKDAKLRYLLYKEDVSKANAGGLKHRKVVPKCVRAFENPENRNKCIVTVFEKYKSLCPANGGKDCFYLTPLKHIKDGQWYSNNPIGHNTLQGTVKRLCASIGLTGKRTNHSLRASAATRLYNAGIEEQRVAETTGHRSNAVRVYKRTSADQQLEASNILYGLRPSDGRKKAKPSAAAGAPVSSVSVECSTDESDKKTVTCNFSLNFSL